LDFCVVDVTSRHEYIHEAVHKEIADLRARCAEVMAADAAALWRPVVDGAQIMERYGLSPGPLVGQMLGRVSSAQKAAEGEGSPLSADDAWALLDSSVAGH
jgi:hypothetical protein